jgi:hypothetical protein
MRLFALSATRRSLSRLGTVREIQRAVARGSASKQTVAFSIFNC